MEEPKGGAPLPNLADRKRKVPEDDPQIPEKKRKRMQKGKAPLPEKKRKPQ